MGAVVSLAHAPSSAPSVWRVVIVRLPPPGAPGPLGRGARRRRVATAPAVVYTGSDEGAALALAGGLRELGAEVVVVEDRDGGSSLCAAHLPHLCAEECQGCGRPICVGCRLAAGDEPLCATCSGRARRRLYWGRVRQLFAILVFVAFLYAVHTWRTREEALFDPHGPVDVVVYQFVRPGVAGAPLVRALAADDAPTGLAAIADWYTAEHARYTAETSPYLTFTTEGPWVTDVAPPRLDDPDASAWKLLYRAYAYTEYFHHLARTFGEDPSRHTARLYVVYGAEDGDLASDSRGSRKGRVAVSFIPVDSATVAYAQVTVAHELGHVLGAEDLYDPETYLAKFPEGFVQPWARPPYPQRYAELMAADIPVTPADEREVSSLDEVRIGYRTAASMGWIPRAEAEQFYTPAAVSPDAVLPGPSAPATPDAATPGTPPA